MAQSMSMLKLQPCSIELEEASFAAPFAREAGRIGRMAHAVVDIAPAEWARFEARVNAPRSYATDLA